MYKGRKKIIYALSFLSILLCLSDGIAHDDEITHPKITEEAIRTSDLGGYLTTNLGFLEGAKKILGFNGEWRTIEEWLKKGSKLEDDPICRASNHFHNPLDPWNLSYMTDEPWYVNLWCDVTGYATRYSNVTWGTGYQSPNGPTIDRINQQMGWDNAKNDYYIAVTSIFRKETEGTLMNSITFGMEGRDVVD